MMVLVDTSVWISHFRKTDERLIGLLTNDCVLTHPFVIGEIACGTPPAPRSKTLSDLKSLQATKQSSMGEVLDFIERERLFGLGCGLVDVFLLASALLTPNTKLWTYDRNLNELASKFGISYTGLDADTAY